jgi:hypothetical protein
MTVFRKVIDALSLNSQSQGSNDQHGLIWFLLTLCDQYETANPSADVLTDPAQELLRRFSTHRESFAFRDIARLLSAKFGTV